MLNVIRRYNLFESIYEIMQSYREIDIKTERVDIILFICSANKYAILEDTQGQMFVIPYDENLDKNFLELYNLQCEDIIEIEIRE